MDSRALRKRRVTRSADAEIEAYDGTFDDDSAPSASPPQQHQNLLTRGTTPYTLCSDFQPHDGQHASQQGLGLPSVFSSDAQESIRAPFENPGYPESFSSISTHPFYDPHSAGNPSVMPSMVVQEATMTWSHSQQSNFEPNAEPPMQTAPIHHAQESGIRPMGWQHPDMSRDNVRSHGQHHSHHWQSLYPDATFDLSTASAIPPVEVQFTHPTDQAGFSMRNAWATAAPHFFAAGSGTELGNVVSSLPSTCAAPTNNVLTEGPYTDEWSRSQHIGKQHRGPRPCRKEE